MREIHILSIQFGKCNTSRKIIKTKQNKNNHAQVYRGTGISQLHKGKVLRLKTTRVHLQVFCLRT